jgi:xanthine dehydrogenase/oxidase
VVAHILNIDLELVSVKPSNNMTSPNGMVSGFSVTSESCAYVSVEICNNLVCILHFLLGQLKLFSSTEVLSMCVYFPL